MRELILTGFKDFWPQDEKKALFLGPWCFADNHKYKFWDHNKFNLAPSHWKTPQDILEASLYIDSLIDRIIPSLSILMNDLHKTSYSNKFWKIYLIVWLVHWLGTCYDRYQRLKCLEKGVSERLKVKVINDKRYIVNGYWQAYQKEIENHYYNLVLMSDIIINSQFNFLDIEVYPPSDNALVETKINTTSMATLHPSFESLKRLIKKASNYVINYISSTLYLGNIHGVSSLDRFYFQLFYEPLCMFKGKDNDNLFEIAKDRNDLNNRTLEFNALNDFEEVIKKIILFHLPTAFLKIFSRANNQNLKTRVWIGNDIYISEKYAFRIAEICENNGKWISAQHGGGYGQWYSSPIGKIEYETSNGFITWGWSHKHIYHSQYYPLPSPMLSKLPRHKEHKKQIVYVSTMHPAYYYRLHSALKPEQLLKYMENKEAFLIYLKDDIRLSVKYKPYFYDYGIGEIDYICKILSPEQILKTRRLVNEIKKSRLVVIDHVATTISEAFAMNAPTILFWDPEHFVVCKEAAPYFDGLRKAGILFDSPEAAAKKINEIWHDVLGWWQKPEVQKAKDGFCYQFARTSKNWRKEWRDFLRAFK